MKRLVVFGGGGSVGVAWETGIAAGLLAGGLDLRDADAFIGTSAGAVVSANLAHGRDPRETLRRLREESPPPAAGEWERDAATIGEIFRIWGGGEATTTEGRARVGALALEAKTMPEDVWLTGYERNEWPGWPAKRLLACAVECETGEFRRFDASSGVPFVRAVAASCTIPGIFPPVAIGGLHYIDGAVRSWTTADIALDEQPERVLIIAPAGVPGPGVRGLAARQVVEEMAALAAAGVEARLVELDDAARPLAENLMDASRREAIAAAGEAQARRIAGELGGWWDG
jgi:NTE family protein